MVNTITDWLQLPFVMIDWSAFAAGAGVAYAGLEPHYLVSLTAGVAYSQVSGDRFKDSWFRHNRGEPGDALNVISGVTSSMIGTFAARYII